MAVSETERVDVAIEEAVALVEDGDRPLVAADYVAEQHDLDHRFEDILERVQEAPEETADTDQPDDEVDTRHVYLAPAATPYDGKFHTSESCAGRGDGGPVRETHLEKVVKEGYERCGICAKTVTLEAETDG